jgi:hypothetical protein
MKPDDELPGIHDETISRFLDRIGMVGPPADLKDNVLRAIAARPPAPVRGRWLDSIRASFRRRPLLGALYPFAAGAAAAAVVFAILSGNPAARLRDRPGSLSGTMVPAPPGAAGRTIDEQRFELNGANVHLTAIRTSDVLKAVVDARSDLEVEIVLVFDPSRLRPIAFRQERPWAGRLEFGEGRLRIQRRGEVEYEFVFKALGAGEAPIQVIITADGGTVQGVLHTGSGGSGT